MIKKISRFFFSLILVLGTFTALTACGSGKVKAVAESLAITTAPTKVNYVEGETFDPTGIVLTLTYDDGSTKDLGSSDYTYDLTRSLKTSDRNVTFTYTDGADITLTAKQKIKVTNDVTSVTVKSQPTQTEYMAGEIFNPAGLVLTTTYQSGKTEDVSPAAEELEYSKDPLRGTETSVKVSFGGKEFDIAITFAKGVFIEAETGILNSSSGKTYDDAVGKEDQYNATGGLYVGNMKANDSIIFQFSSDKAGTGDIAFRLASQYLKEDNNWTPIWMGDCQFNKICEFSVNGVKYDIPDEAILPGGGSQGGETNGNLWFNWKEVEFKNIAFIEGLNQIELKFIPHDYTDTSQSSFSGSFTANIDSLKVTSSDCEVIPALLPEITSYLPTKAYLENVEDVPYFVVEGTVTYEGVAELAEEALYKALEFDFQGNLENSTSRKLAGAGTRSVKLLTNENGAGTFKMSVNVSSLAGDNLVDNLARYSTHFGEGLKNFDNFNEKGKIDPENVATGADKALTIGHFTYELVYDWQYSSANADNFPEAGDSAARKAHYYGCVGLKITSDGTYIPEKQEFTGVSIANEGGKAILTVSGTLQGFDSEAAWKAQDWHWDLQTNCYAAAGTWDGPWTYECKDSNATFACDLKAGTFTVKIDITDVPAYTYTTHLNVGVNESGNNAGQAKDCKVDLAYDETISLNGKTYRAFSVPGSTEGAECWGCIGIVIAGESTTPVEPETPVDPSTANLQLVKGETKRYEVENATPTNWKASGFTEFVGEDASASGGKFVTSSTGDNTKSGTFSFTIYVPEDGKVTLTAAYSQADGKKANEIPMDRTFKIVADSTEFTMTSEDKNLAPIDAAYDWRTFTYEATLTKGVHTITVSVKENTTKGCPCIDYFDFAL